MHKNFELYGEILWLWSNSPLHNNWPLSAACAYIIPAISTKQFVLLKDMQNMPRAYASWAFMSDESELKYLKDPASIELQDWTSGSKLWFIDFIAPFGFKDVGLLRRQLSHIHGDKYLARSIRIRANQKAKVGEHSAGSIDLAKSEALKQQYFDQFSKNLNI